jgi:hypothetical protein
MRANKRSLRFGILFFLSLLVAFPGAIMMIIGIIDVDDYHRHKDDPFIPTTCYLTQVKVVDAVRSKKSAFYIDISVNYTVNNVTRERNITYAALQSEQEANLIASQLSSQGQIECYYHPADDFPLLAVPSLSYLYEHGLGLTIPGCLMVAGGLILLTTICVLDCRTPQQRFELNSSSYVAPAPKVEQPEASVAIECGKNAVGMQKMP